MSEQITALVEGTRPLTNAIVKAGDEIDSARDTIAKVGTNLQNALAGNMGQLTAAINAAAKASDDTAKALVSATRWLFAATVILAILTGIIAIESAHRMGWF